MWLDDINVAMNNLGGSASLQELYLELERILIVAKLTDSWKSTVRNTIECHSSDSDNFKGNDIFYSVNGKGNGVWGLRNCIPFWSSVVSCALDNFGGNASMENLYLEIEKVTSKKLSTALKDTILKIIKESDLFSYNIADDSCKIIK